MRRYVVGILVGVAVLVAGAVWWMSREKAPPGGAVRPATPAPPREPVQQPGKEQAPAAPEPAPLPTTRPAGRLVLGRDEIRDAIRAVTPLMQECFEKRLAESDVLEAKTVLTFSIVAQDGQGHLDHGEVKSSTLQDDPLESCMLRNLTRARFPVPPGSGRITVTYPFRFRRGQPRSTPPARREPP